MKLLTALFTGPFFGICGFLFGIYFPWDDLFNCKYDNKFYITSIIGRLLGMIVCSIVFGIVSFAYGLAFPWLIYNG